MSFESLIARKGLLGGKYSSTPTSPDGLEQRREPEEEQWLEEEQEQEQEQVKFQQEQVLTPRREAEADMVIHTTPRRKMSPPKILKNTYAGKMVNAANKNNNSSVITPKNGVITTSSGYLKIADSEGKSDKENDEAAIKPKKKSPSEYFSEPIKVRNKGNKKYWLTPFMVNLKQ